VLKKKGRTGPGTSARLLTKIWYCYSVPEGCDSLGTGAFFSSLFYVPSHSVTFVLESMLCVGLLQTKKSPCRGDRTVLQDSLVVCLA